MRQRDLAEQLAGIGVARGDRVAVWHGDSAAIHVLFVAIERCGAVVVGIGARAGTREVVRDTAQRAAEDPDQRSSARAGPRPAAADELRVPALVLGRDGGTLRLDVDARAQGVGGRIANSAPTTSS